MRRGGEGGLGVVVAVVDVVYDDDSKAQYHELMIR